MEGFQLAFLFQDHKLVLGETPGQMFGETPLNPVLNGFPLEQLGSLLFAVLRFHISLHPRGKSVSFLAGFIFLRLCL